MSTASILSAATPASCWEQVQSFNIDIGKITNFDSGHGIVLLTNGNVCWDSLRTAVSTVGDFLNTQLANMKGPTTDKVVSTIEGVATPENV